MREGCMFCADAGMDFDYCRVCGRGEPERLAEPVRRPLFDGSGCGHPPDPIAQRVIGDDAWACHCGRILDPRDGMEIPEAPGPVVQCGKCGCHVAIPSIGSASS